MVADKKFASMDVEIGNDFPEDFDTSGRDFSRLLLSVGAIATGYNSEDVIYYEGYPSISKERAQEFVLDMMKLVKLGYYIFGWNILGFDFPVIANASGMMQECADLAINHSIDPMFQVACMKGYFLGLDKALIGAGIPTKLHEVQLNDGSMKTDMSGVHAPSLWMAKEFSAVRDYLHYDVVNPLKLAYHLDAEKTLNWTSGTGKPMSLKFDMLTPKDAITQIPFPNVSWMDKPKMRWEYYEWIPKDIQISMGLYRENKKSSEDLMPDIDDELPF